MQTLGALVDILQVINLKMWNAQKNVYKIRHMTKEKFMSTYSNPKKLEQLYEFFKATCDLNIQRANATDDIDEFIVKLVKGIKDGSIDTTKLLQRKHKAY